MCCRVPRLSVAAEEIVKQHSARLINSLNVVMAELDRTATPCYALSLITKYEPLLVLQKI